LTTVPTALRLRQDPITHTAMTSRSCQLENVAF